MKQEIDIYTIRRDKMSRVGRLTLPNGKRLLLPFLWFSVWIDDEIRKRYGYFVHHDFREGLLVNALHILERPNICKKIEKFGIHSVLEFDRAIMADSGGFLFREQEEVNINPLTLLSFYEKSNVDIGLILDHPPDPKSLMNDNEKRLRTTLKNTQIMFKSKRKSELLLLPIISATSIHRIRNMIEHLRRIISIKAVCIGGIVPLIRTQIPNGRRFMVDLIVEIRRLLPESFIHVLGIGGTTTMHLMFYLGVDSVDSCSWEKKAAYGLIQLPKVGDRYIIKRGWRKRYPVLNSEEYKMLLECKCPVCRKHSPEDLDKSRELRVLHNAWVFQNEVNMARQMIKERAYEKFVEDRLKCSNMYSTFKYARQRLQQIAQVD